MRILHTSDWHIGRTFHGYATLEPVGQVLDELAAVVAERQVDVVVVAGDVFDSATPSGEAYAVLQAALRGIRSAGAQIVLVGGNHDSARRLGFASPFTALGGLHIIADAEAVGSFVTIDDEHGPVDFYGLAFLEPALVRHLPWATGEMRTQADVLGRAMDLVRSSIDARPAARSVVVAHTFVAGAQSESAESERPIVAGGVDCVPVSAFAGVDYVALGHIHGRSTLADTIRYPGALLHYSFSEAGKPRGAWLVDLGADGRADVSWVDLPVPRPLVVLTDTFDALLASADYERYRDHWVRAVYTDRSRVIDAMSRLKGRFPWCADVAFEPAEGSDADETSYAARVRGRTDHEIVAAFLDDVRGGDGQTAAEQAIVDEVIAQRRAMRQSA